MSSYMIKAVLSNPRHPEYGQVTIPFPIPNEEYDSCVERLKAMEFGDALQRDCQVDEVDSYYDVLKRLEGQSVNVDELEYLAKRLDSFCMGEDAQFQGMAARLDISIHWSPFSGRNYEYYFETLVFPTRLPPP